MQSANVRSSRRRVLSVIPAYMPSVYILLKPLHALADAGEIELRVLLEKDVKRTDVLWADVVHFIRNTDPTCSALYRMIYHLGVPFIYELDDNLLAVPGDSPIARYHQNPDVRAQIEYLLRYAHLVRVYSPVLRDIILAYNPNTEFVVPAIDWSIMPAELPPLMTEPFKIVYPTSRVTGDPFYGQFWPDVARILDEYGSRVEMHFFGYLPPEAEGRFNVHFHPLQKYDAFLREFTSGGYALGLAPMFRDLFYQCKTNNKFREYAAAGVVGVYLDTPLYSEAVRHGENGFLISGEPGTWYTIIRHAIEHADQLDAMRRAARALAEERYSLDAVVARWRADLAALPARRGITETQILLQRMANIRARENGRVPIVTALLPGIIPSTQINITMPLRYLHEQGAIVYRELLERDATPRAVLESDVIVACRNMEPYYQPLFELALRFGIPLIFDIDDNLLDVPREPVSETAHEYYHAPERQAHLRWLIRRAHLVRTYSPVLAEILRAHNLNVERTYSPFDWTLPPAWIPPLTLEPVRIVYATSRFDRDPLFDDIAGDVRDALVELGERAELHLYGHQSAHFVGLPNVRSFPFERDYDTFMRHFTRAGFAIGLAPAPDHSFYNCKTNTKVRDYAAAGAAGLYSDTPLYREYVRHDVTGVLVPNAPGAWKRAILELAADPARIERIRQAARNAVEIDHNIERSAADWLTHIEQVIGGRALDPDLRQQLIAIGETWVERATHQNGQERPEAPAFIPLDELRTDDDLHPTPALEQPSAAADSRLDPGEIIVEVNCPPARAVRVARRAAVSVMPAHDNWSGIEIMVGMHGVALRGVIALTVRAASGAIVRQSQRLLSEAVDNAWLGFGFVPITNARGQIFSLTFTVSGLAPGTMLSLYETAQPQIHPVIERLRRHEERTRLS
ncbi:MAG: glycosyltransferase, partial [Anaerolinea sp.]|nr:glycosyltransferase [Anaerolinea sp.]